MIIYQSIKLSLHDESLKHVRYTYAGSNPQTGPDDRRLSLGYLEYHSEGLHYFWIDCFRFSCGIQIDIKSKDG